MDDNYGLEGDKKEKGEDIDKEENKGVLFEFLFLTTTTIISTGMYQWMRQGLRNR
jgi:hypothetical protein